MDTKENASGVLADAASPSLRILIADDTATDRLVLKSIVESQGHRVISAGDGREAVDCFRREQPDLVLLDVLMPELDGLEAAQQIKALAGETLVPVIFLTSLNDAESLARCLEAGGDDFLQKPYNPVILKAKIGAFNRMRELHGTMLAQRDQISRHNQHLIQEQTVAKQVFDNIAHSGCLDASNVKYHLSPRAVFNGDVLVAALRPSGNMMLLLGDFTGHGLPAAIGAMPLASIFYGMVHKGFSLTDILREINQKLKTILPIGVFCCASFAEFNFRERYVTIWNGGLPAACIYRQRRREVELVDSRHLPLGVLSSPQLKVDCEQFELEEGDRCFFWSDGIHEARNPAGEMFGEERLREVLRRSRDPERLFGSIMDAVHHFVGGGQVDDDLSLAEVSMVAPEAVRSRAMPEYSSRPPGLMEWSLDFEIGPSTFRHFDPLPLLLRVIAEVPGLRTHSGRIYSILAELYSNALEHGILRLDSELKKSREGFSEYYLQRERRLQEQDSGRIAFHLAHETQEEGGTLRIRVRDSGTGFPYDRVLRAAERPDEVEYSGRGLRLLQQICESVEFRGKGNQVEAVYSWTDRPGSAPPGRR